MKSRYDFMTESSVADTEDKSYYPDSLSLNYNLFTLSTPATPLELSDLDIAKFWWTIQKHYGTAEYDDMVLTLNGIEHTNFLTAGDVMFMPSISDIEASFRQKGSA